MKLLQFKAFCLSLLLVLVSTLVPVDRAIAQPFTLRTFFIAQAAPSSPSPQTTQPAAPKTTQDTAPSDQAVTNSKATERKPAEAKAPVKATAEAKQPQAGGPYDMKAINDFYKSLYGS